MVWTPSFVAFAKNERRARRLSQAWHEFQVLETFAYAPHLGLNLDLLRVEVKALQMSITEFGL